MTEPTAAEKVQAAIWIIENQTPNENHRLKKLLCMANGIIRALPDRSPIQNLILDALNRELGIDDLKLARLNKDMEKIKK